MNKFFSLAMCLLITGTVLGQEPLFETLKKELDYNHSVLKEQATPAYYISLRLDQVDWASSTANMGQLTSVGVKFSPTNCLSATMRVGSPELDNTHEVREAGSSPGYILGYDITIDNNEKDLRNTIWTHLDLLYKQESQDYEKIKANMAVKVEQEDKSPDFSVEEVENYYEAPIRWGDLNIDLNSWNEKVKKYSAVFNENSDLSEGQVSFFASVVRTISVDTEGREIAYNSISLRLILSAQTMADDGMVLPLYKSWWAHSISEMPSDEEVMAAAKEISRTLSELKVAPVAESYTGPALLAPEAASVFFHEIFGHRIEGARLKQESDTQTFKKKIGEYVLPKHISVIFDPNEKYYNGKPIAGHYPVDDEGIKGQRVKIVENGILKNFLMSRTPIEGFSKSNGHGRYQLGYPFVVTRQSNMFIESTQKNTYDDLIKKLRKEAKSQGKEYAYLFKDVSGGFTQISRYSISSFNVSPLVVYRIYVDGRPNELVRGVDLVGTPLTMFSQITDAGTDYGVFNGMCGAESGWLPVSAVSPTLLVKQIETQKKAKSQAQGPILSKPVPEINPTGLSNQEIIMQSIKKEVQRSINGLKTDELEAPFFIAYVLRDGYRLNMGSSNGGLTYSQCFPFRSTDSRMLAGNYQTTDENFLSERGRAMMNYSSNTPFCAEANEEGIRYSMWREFDSQFKQMAESYKVKTAALKQLNIPAEKLELPDWEQKEAVQLILPSADFSIDVPYYEQYLNELSAILASSTKNLYSNVGLEIVKSDIYLYNTEKTEIRIPYSYAILRLHATQKDETGENFYYNWVYPHNDPKNLPTKEEFRKEAERIGQLLSELTAAPKLDEAYTGPVLFVDNAVSNAFYNNFFSQNFSLVATPKTMNASGQSFGNNKLEEMIGKRVTSTNITVEDLTGTSTYNGKELFGYAPIDAQGVAPAAQTVLIEKGILQTLLNDRTPTEKVRNSTGHALFMSNGGFRKNTGVIRMSYAKQKSREALMNELFKLANEAGYEYAYIAKNLNGNAPELYRVYPDGREERLTYAMINNFNNDSFKKVIAAADSEKIYEFLAGNKVSVIVPEAILFEELQIQNNGVNNFNRPPLVPRPVIGGE